MLLNVLLSMKKIALSGGKKYALVDNKDYEWLNQWIWGIDESRQTFYAVRSATLAGGKRKDTRMHRLIIEATEGEICDHKNGDGLDNRRCNLRKCTAAENARNRRPAKHKKYKGVHWKKQNQRWTACIWFANVLHHLGYFDSEIDAARAYNNAAKKHFGEFAFLNIIP